MGKVFSGRSQSCDLRLGRHDRQQAVLLQRRARGTGWPDGGRRVSDHSFRACFVFFFWLEPGLPQSGVFSCDIPNQGCFPVISGMGAHRRSPGSAPTGASPIRGVFRDARPNTPQSFSGTGVHKAATLDGALTDRARRAPLRLAGGVRDFELSESSKCWQWSNFMPHKNTRARANARTDTRTPPLPPPPPLLPRARAHTHTSRLPRR